jgi:hypothetical protein
MTLIMRGAHRQTDMDGPIRCSSLTPEREERLKNLHYSETKPTLQYATIGFFRFNKALAKAALSLLFQTYGGRKFYYEFQEENGK